MAAYSDTTKLNLTQFSLHSRIIIFAYLRNLKAPIQTHFLKHYLLIIVV